MNRSFIGLAALAAALALPAPASAGFTGPNLGGTWTGTATCTVLESDGVTKTKTSSALTVRISGGGGGLIAEIDDETPGTTGPFGGGLCGMAFGTTSKGVATLGIAGFTAGLVYDEDLPVESLHFKSVKVDEVSGAGTMSGSGPLIPYVDFSVGTCKVKLTRTNAMTPTVDSSLASECGF